MAMLPDLQKSLFDSAINSPGSWLIEARSLRDAARRLDWLERPEADDEFGLMHIYRMLMGLSFENLVKGVLIAEGHRADAAGELSKMFTTHKLTNLASKVQDARFQISIAEMEILRELEPYILWAGRYPVPKSFKSVIARQHSSGVLSDESAFWERLFSYLNSIAWITKADGSRLYLVRQNDTIKPPDFLR